MNKQHRWNIIAELCQKKDQVSVDEMVEMIGVSPATIRRDLQEMEDMRIISRYHGGARIIPYQDELHMLLRSETNIRQKREVARYAASLLHDNQMIYLDAGTTTYEIIPFIKAKNITVVTPGIRHALELARKEIATIVLGGPLRAESELTAGRTTVEQIKDHHFDLALMATNGIHDNNGFTTFSETIALTKNTAMTQSKLSYIVTDSSKFYMLQPAVFAKFDDAIVICDDLPESFRNSGIRYILPDGENNISGFIR
jgi:DeoR family fructose operon transcriptional repressor